MDETLDIMRLSSKLEMALLGDGDRRHVLDVPWITLPPGYSFKVTFPFAGAAARFRVCKTDKPDNDVSVYLDTQHVLGYFGMPGEKPAPYWEAYPIGDDTARFPLEDTKGLVDAIIEHLNKPVATVGE